MILGRREWPWIQSPHFEVINQGMNQGANIITKEQSSKLSVTNSSRLWMVSWISPETRSCTRSSVLRPQCQVNTQLRELRREFSSFQKKKCPEPQIHMTSASLSHTNLSSNIVQPCLVDTCRSSTQSTAQPKFFCWNGSFKSSKPSKNSGIVTDPLLSVSIHCHMS